jgi:hypothetical protein
VFALHFLLKMEHRRMLAVEHHKGAENKVRYAVFPAVAGASGIRLRRRRFLQALQELLDDSPSHAGSIASFLNSELLILAGECLQKAGL